MRVSGRARWGAQLGHFSVWWSELPLQCKLTHQLTILVLMYS